MKRIVFLFKENGTVETDVNGVKGKSCISEVEKLLATLKPELKSRTLKKEYHAEVSQETAATIHE